MKKVSSKIPFEAVPKKETGDAVGIAIGIYFYGDKKPKKDPGVSEK